MKKILFTISTILSLGLTYSQTIFSENFDGLATLPNGWTQYNVDGNTPSLGSGIDFGNNAWVAYNDMVVSTSCYVPTFVANDWLITPQIAIPAMDTYALQFDARAPDGDFPDGFKIYISTTGNAVADFGINPVLIVNAAPQELSTYLFDLSAYVGQSIYIAVQNFSNDKFLLYLDNFVVRKLPENDANLVSSSLNRLSAINTNNTLSLNVKNEGANQISSLTVNWNDGTDHSSVINTNIASGSSATVNHPIAVTYNSVVDKTITVTITNVNNAADDNMANNVSEIDFNTVSELVTKKVLFEEGTGTWCGWCPRGGVIMDYMANQFANFIGIAVHNGDPMQLDAYNTGAGFSSFPKANVDRVLFGEDVDQNSWTSIYNNRKNLIVPVAIDATVGINGSQATINASATFKINETNADYRLGVIIVEDDVTGSTSGYNQTNYYSSSAQNINLIALDGTNWKNLPNPVPAAQMVYNHVGRALLGGYNGQTGSVPANLTDGQVVNYTFNYTIPATSERTNMHAVVVLLDNNTGEVVNSNSFNLYGLAGIKENDQSTFEIFPNPSTDIVNVTFEAVNNEYDITIYDLQGKLVSTKNFKNLSGLNKIEYPVSELKAGNYLITLSTKGESFTQHLVIK